MEVDWLKPDDSRCLVCGADAALPDWLCRKCYGDGWTEKAVIGSVILLGERMALEAKHAKGYRCAFCGQAMTPAHFSQVEPCGVHGVVDIG